MDTYTLPIDLEVETAFTGAVLAGCAGGLFSTDEVMSVASPEMLTDADLQKVYRACIAADAVGEPIDLVSIATRLRLSPPPVSGDWIRTLIQTAESVPSAANTMYYARRVRQLWQLRRLMAVCQRIRNLCCHPLAEPGELTAALVAEAERIEARSTGDREAVPEQTLLRSYVNPAERMTTTRVPVGVGELGYVLGHALDGGTLTIIGARPSCGKTSLGLGLCVHAAKASDGCPSLFASVEMSAQQVAVRLLAMRSGLSVSAIRTGHVGPEQFDLARDQAVGEARDGHPVYILDGVRDARAIAAYARRMARRDGVRMLVVDYLGLCSMPGDYDRHDLRVGAMSALFKSLSLEADMAVVVLDQLNRASARDNRRPGLHDLRDSGQTEANADNVILIHRSKDAGGDCCDTTMIVAKQRQGGTGDAAVQYYRPMMTYRGKYDGADDNA